MDPKQFLDRYATRAHRLWRQDRAQRQHLPLRETWRGTLKEAVAWVDEKSPKGELVVVLEGAPEPLEATDEDIDAAVRAHLEAGETARDAAAAVSEQLDVSKRRAYDAAIRLR